MTDITEIVSQACYGKSSRLNAPENQNEDFREGYRIGHLHKSESLDENWFEAYRSYGSPEPSDARWKLWSDWKRGFHAGHMQRVLFEIAQKE